MEQQTSYKYFAFISYNSRDINWGKRVQKKLEQYRMPASLCKEHGWERKPIKPIFFAPTDIQLGGLTAELQERLKASRNLIVICSPDSARSKWVGKEIEYFHSLGRTDNIHFFIVSGEPNSGNPATECFNPVVKELGLPEILGANIHEKIYRWPWLNKERAYVQLVTTLLGVEFDSIWQRHKRAIVKRFVSWTCALFAVLFLFLFAWSANQPRDMRVGVRDMFYNAALPEPDEIIVTLGVGGEERVDTIGSFAELSHFRNIPAKFFGKEISLNVRCRNYMNLDTTLVLADNINIGISRDPSVFGNVHFYVKDKYGESAVTGVEVLIAGISAVSSQDGLVEFAVPLEKQNVKYVISSSVPFVADTLYMPCSRDTSIRLK